MAEYPRITKKERTNHYKEQTHDQRIDERTEDITQKSRQSGCEMGYNLSIQKIRKD